LPKGSNAVADGSDYSEAGDYNSVFFDCAHLKFTPLLIGGVNRLH